MSSPSPSVFLVVNAVILILGHRHMRCHAIVVVIVRRWGAAFAAVAVATIAAIAIVAAAVRDVVADIAYDAK